MFMLGFVFLQSDTNSIENVPEKHRSFKKDKYWVST